MRDLTVLFHAVDPEYPDPLEMPDCEGCAVSTIAQSYRTASAVNPR
jgi:hypothetical protein